MSYPARQPTQQVRARILQDITDPALMSLFIKPLEMVIGDFCMLQTILYTSNCRFDQSDTDQSTVSERSKENLV